MFPERPQKIERTSSHAPLQREPIRPRQQGVRTCHLRNQKCLLEGSLSSLCTELSVRPSIERSFRKLFCLGLFQHTAALQIRLAVSRHSVAGPREASHRRQKCFCRQVDYQIPRLAETGNLLSQQRVRHLLKAQSSFRLLVSALCCSFYLVFALLRTPYVTIDFLVGMKSRPYKPDLFLVHRFLLGGQYKSNLFKYIANSIIVAEAHDFFARM